MTSISYLGGLEKRTWSPRTEFHRRIQLRERQKVFAARSRKVYASDGLLLDGPTMSKRVGAPQAVTFEEYKVILPDGTALAMHCFGNMIAIFDWQSPVSIHRVSCIDWNMHPLHQIVAVRDKAGS